MEAKPRVWERRLLLGLAAVLIAGGTVGAAFAARLPNGSGRAGATVAFRRISNPVPAVASVNCGRGVPGRGFHVYACMSGGVLAGQPHPKELLVVRSDGSSVAYPAFRVGELAVGDGAVVATSNINLVRVTDSRLVPLLTTGGLGRALHIRSTAIMDVYDPRLDARGDIYFVASILSRSECQKRTLERTAGGTIQQIRTSRNHGCG